MKERPILFSAPMVNAILEGRKTQTRRIVKPQPHASDNNYGDIEESERYPGEWFQWKNGEPLPSFVCPHGVPGDRLWVRETHWINEEEKLVAYRADGEMPAHMKGSKWKPSIFMPRWASRITLEITDVRVERLQEISNDDAKAEGVYCAPHRGGTCGMADTGIDQCAICPYRDLWNSLRSNLKPEEFWHNNPWVWVISFKMINT